MFVVVFRSRPFTKYGANQVIPANAQAHQIPGKIYIINIDEALNPGVLPYIWLLHICHQKGCIFSPFCTPNKAPLYWWPESVRQQGVLVKIIQRVGKNGQILV